jgi:hypothetical protein
VSTTTTQHVNTNNTACRQTKHSKWTQHSRSANIKQQTKHSTPKNTQQVNTTQHVNKQHVNKIGHVSKHNHSKSVATSHVIKQCQQAYSIPTITLTSSTLAVLHHVNNQPNLQPNNNFLKKISKNKTTKTNKKQNKNKTKQKRKRI